MYLFKFTLAAMTLSFSYLYAQSGIEIEASVSKNRMSLQDRFSYRVEIRGESRGTLPEVQLPDFNDFYIAGGPNQSTNFQFINGEISSSVIYSWELVPRRSGSFKIQPATAEYRGKTYATKEINITVYAQGNSSVQGTTEKSGKSSGTSEPTFLLASVDKEKVYKGEQVTVTYRIYTKVRLVNFNTPSPPAAVGFWVEEIPQPSQPIVEEEVVDGTRYSTAVVAKFALFPTRSGELHLDRIAIDYKERVRRRRSNSIFDDFFDDPFFGRYANKRVVSNDLSIEVLPLPEKGKPDDFRGAVGDYKLSAEIVESEAKVNDAVTLRVRLSGSGNIKTVKAPEIDFPDAVEVFEPEIKQKSSIKRGRVTGEKTFEYVLILRREGVLDIGRIGISYFNPESGSYESSLSDRVRFEVEEGDRSIVAVSPGLSREEVAILSRDIHFIKRDLPELVKRDSRGYLSAWLIVWGVSPMFGLAGAFLLRRHLDQMNTNVAYQRRRRASSESRKKLKAAKGEMESENAKGFYFELGRALLGAAADRMNLPAARVTAEEIVRALKERGADEKDTDEFLKIISLCREAVYSPEQVEESRMEEIYTAAERSLDKLLKVL